MIPISMSCAFASFCCVKTLFVSAYPIAASLFSLFAIGYVFKYKLRSLCRNFVLFRLGLLPHVCVSFVVRDKSTMHVHDESCTRGCRGERSDLRMLVF